MHCRVGFLLESHTILENKFRFGFSANYFDLEHDLPVLFTPARSPTMWRLLAGMIISSDRFKASSGSSVSWYNDALPTVFQPEIFK